MFQDKVLLVTGGTGSFGNAVVKRLLKENQIKEIRILSRDEKKQDDMNLREGVYIEENCGFESSGRQHDPKRIS